MELLLLASLGVVIIRVFIIFLRQVFEAFLSSLPINKRSLATIREVQISKMESGQEFEELIYDILKADGYVVEYTPCSHDYGADIIASQCGIKSVIQVKMSRNTIGVSAVQEVVSAIKYYQADCAVVITNNYFSKNAYKLADANNVELWDKDELTALMKRTGVRRIYRWMD